MKGNSEGSRGENVGIVW